MRQARKAEQQRVAAEEQRQRQEKIVAELWPRYLAEVVLLHNKPSTAALKSRLWEGRIKPTIGHLKLNAVSEEDVSAVVRAPLRLDASGQVIGGEGEAGDLYRLMHHVFKQAIVWRLRRRELGNPLEAIAEPKVTRRERLLNDREVSVLLQALNTAEADDREQPQIIAAIRFIVVTGFRIDEVLSLCWTAIRRDLMEVWLPDTKTGFHVARSGPLLLPHWIVSSRCLGCRWYSMPPRIRAKALTYNTVGKTFRRIATAAGVKDCSPHTLRHWFATMTANRVNNPRIGMAQIGHKSYSAYINYVHGYRMQTHALAAEMGNLTSGLETASSNVHPLPLPPKRRSRRSGAA